MKELLQNGVGGRIKELRKSKGWTLKDLGGASDLSVSFLSDVERDRACPSVSTLMDIAKILDTSAAYLTGEVDSSVPFAPNAIATVSALANTPEGLEVLEILRKFPLWPQEYQKEALHYLQYLESKV